MNYTVGNFCLYGFLFLIWLYFLILFRRKKLEFFYFLSGSIGMFLFSFFLLQPVLTPGMTKMISWLTGLAGRATGIFTSYSSYSILFIENADGPISLYVDFECAGLIEILVFVSLITFFSVYNAAQKLLVYVLGTLWITLANIIRLFTICCIIHYFGNETYYIAHTIIGRLIFYALSILMYFYVFTRAQVRKQRVGEFEYADKDD